jgi:hypothetical protein
MVQIVHLMQRIHSMMMTNMVPWVMIAISMVMIIGSSHERVIHVPWIMVMGVMMMINGRIIRDPLVTMIIVCVGAVMVNIMMMPEHGIMMVIGTVPIKTLRSI